MNINDAFSDYQRTTAGGGRQEMGDGGKHQQGQTGKEMVGEQRARAEGQKASKYHFLISIQKRLNKHTDGIINDAYSLEPPFYAQTFGEYHNIRTLDASIYKCL